MYGNSIFEALYDGVIDERNRKKRLSNNDPETVAYDARGVKIGIKLGYEAADYNPED